MVRTFEDYFTAEKEDLNPSSWYTPDMVLLRDEETLPLDLLLYANWKPLCDRAHGHWHWFAPEQIFRLPNEDCVFGGSVHAVQSAGSLGMSARTIGL